MKQPKRNRQVDILPLLVIAVGVILVVGVITWLLLERGQASNAQTGVQETSAPDQEVQRVSLADSKAAFDSKSAVFVDVRDPDSFKTAHIPGAINIPLGELENRISELAPNQWIILYCTWPNEETSARAAQILISRGFKHANPILGGFRAWEEANYPTEKQ